MSDWTVHLEFEEGNSSKFWRARVEGKTLFVNYGKIGANGQTQVKDFPSDAAATSEYDKLVREKRKKGYVDAGGGGGGSAEPDEDGDDDGGDDGEGDDEAPRKPAPVARPAPVAAAARPAGQRFVLESGNRKVETYLSLDGKTVRMDSIETYTSPDAAKKAHERLKKMLAGEGYKE
ncbi:MAG TPA: WGR domain-containing protein [Kofleriaceae bacterium]|nr:WGR domain-containing protein [Kofleriaceae bacterium]